MRLEIKKSRVERILIVFIIVATIFAGILMFISPEVLKVIEGSTIDFGNVIIGFLFIGMGLYGLFYGGKSEWFGERYVIDDEGVTKIMPSGKSLQGKWCDLTFVSCDLKLMGFGDGPAIDISLLWDRVKPSEIERILELTGPESPFAKAREFQLSVSTFSKAERMLLVLYGLILIIGIVMAYGTPFLDNIGIGPIEAYTIGTACALFIMFGFATTSIWRYIKIDLRAIREKRRFLAGIN